MRLAVLAFALLLAVASAAAPAEPGATGVLHQPGRGATTVVDAAVATLGVELVQSATFNSAAHAEILKQSVPAIHERYRRGVAADHLVITYDRPVTLRTAGGEVTALQIVIGLARPDYADAVFTIDDRGRLVAHEKYSGRTAVELRKAVRSSAGAR